MCSLVLLIIPTFHEMQVSQASLFAINLKCKYIFFLFKNSREKVSGIP